MAFSALPARTIALTAGTPAWNFDYDLSSNSAEPGGQLQLSFVIRIIHPVYDFDLSVSPGVPLTVDQNGHIHFNSLSPGDVREEKFTVHVPMNTQQGETYVINYRLESYSQSAPLWGRIGQTPDNVLDTSQETKYALQVQIVTQPQLSIATFAANPSSATVGDTITITAVFQNNGTGVLKGANVTLQLPSGISLTQGRQSQQLGNIDSGHSASLSWTITPTSPGSYSLTLVVSSSNQQPLTASVPITSNPPLLQQLASTTNFVTIIVVIVLIFFVYLIFRRMANY